ncbi:UNVERIFIED_CONTAM: hypothetical protein PYX00_010530 [Menopon gallinae]|uniref:UDENN domain-containing protein n=1 Tax=Menopon gallinae TaxID=328185 RepID=A0AAW2HG11_9NEOP
MEQDYDSPSTCLLPWDRFSAWIHCICVVTFDLELGQALELIYPLHVQMTEQEKTNICYLAFPDSNSGCMGDTRFHFRLRASPQSGKHSNLTAAHLQYNEKCLPTLQANPAYYYGFVYFRQVKDKGLPRGYFQKSVVIISRLPFITLFNEVVGIVAPEYFEHGEPSLEAACHDIDQWPSPQPGRMVTLPIFGTAIQAHVPSQLNKISGSTASIVGLNDKNFSHLTHTILGSVCDVDLFRCFSSLLPYVHLLWELVLVAEPLVVMASHPQICSEMVQALVSIIAPLNFYADYRPYFTIHDSEFKEYTTRTHLPPPVILGVTNPFFAKTLQHWPHIIKTCDSIQANSKHSKLKKGTNLKMLDSKPGVYTHYRPYLKKDKTFLSKLIKGVQTKRPGEVQTALLRQHLQELTESFMIPLERYMASCMPLQKNISPYKAAPVPRPFNQDVFIATLGTAGPQLTSGVKGDWQGLYKRFFKSPNFSGWYSARYQHLHLKLKALQLEALSDADLTEWVRDKQEVEVVDMVLKIREKLKHTDLPLSNTTKDQLKTRMDEIINTLPEDLKQVLKTS